MYLLCIEIADIIVIYVNETDLLRFWWSWVRFLADASATVLSISKCWMALMHTQLQIKRKVGHISADKSAEVSKGPQNPRLRVCGGLVSCLLKSRIINKLSYLKHINQQVSQQIILCLQYFHYAVFWQDFGSLEWIIGEKDGWLLSHLKAWMLPYIILVLYIRLLPTVQFILHIVIYPALILVNSKNCSTYLQMTIHNFCWLHENVIRMKPFSTFFKLAYLFKIK